jgi:putative transposase
MLAPVDDVYQGKRRTPQPRLLQRLRAAGGELTALLPGGSHGGRGKQRLSGSSEQLLRRGIDALYLTRQQRSAAVLARDIRGQALQAGITPPSESTIRRRLQALSLADTRRRGEEHPEAEPIYGATPAADSPLDWVQLDHTDVDLILVDPSDRLPIGRPWITVAIDVFSRCIAGFSLSLEAPSATTRGVLPLAWREQRAGAQNQQRGGHMTDLEGAHGQQ